MGTKTKQMVMTTMMQAFLCRPRVLHRNVRSQSWDVFRLNYVKGKCYTQHTHGHTDTLPTPDTSQAFRDENLFLYFVSIFVDFLLGCVFCVRVLYFYLLLNP